MLLYPKEFNEHVAVYEQVDETYTKRIVWRKNIAFFRCLPSLNPQWKSLYNSDSPGGFIPNKLQLIKKKRA